MSFWTDVFGDSKRDSKRKKSRKKIVKKQPKNLARKPGFYYWGGSVHEVDSKGVSHPRNDLGPNSKGWKRKYQ